MGKYINIRQGEAQWVARLTRNLWMPVSPIKGSRFFYEQELHPHCLVLVGSGNIFERDLPFISKKCLFRNQTKII